uniref:Uncharacterized protein n=1 Tax=Labrus bergylta TaxID=56723 RepID=A0A3Q3NPW9_9LABR
MKLFFIMNLLLSSLFLVAGLFLSSSAQTVEECRPLITPLSTFEPVSLFYFPPGALFKTTKSQWIDFIQTSRDHKQFVQDIGISFTCTYHSLPTCEGCLLYTVDSRTNNNLIHIMNITEPQTIAEVESYRAFYLMAKENHIKHHELVHAMKQARCLGFTGEPDFIYDPEDSTMEGDIMTLDT